MTTIHINDRVRFQPTSYFSDCYARHYESYRLHPRLRVDQDGFCEMYLWEFMEVAGPNAGLGQPALYQSDGIQVLGDKTVYFKTGSKGAT